MTKKLLLFIALLCAFAQGVWAQGNLELSYEPIPNSLGYQDRGILQVQLSVNGKAINAAPGVYVLRLINGNDVKTQKIVVR